MKDTEKFHDLEREIGSFPKPDYEKNFTTETQEKILENVLQFARSYEQKKGREERMKKITVSLASVAAFVLFAILTSSIYKNFSIRPDFTKQAQHSKETKNATNQKDTEHKVSETVLFDSPEYGFTFALPKSWKGYKIVGEQWEGISSDQTNKIIEHGQILSIRHPEWTKEKPKQDIPIMIFTLNQWSALNKDQFHIGAAPIGPTLLGQNNEYVFALPARYNYAFLDGYKEVESILEAHPLQTKEIKN